MNGYMADEMVWNFPHFFGSRFANPNIHFPVYLPGVCIDDFSVEVTCHLDRHFGLAHASRAANDYQEFVCHIVTLQGV